MSAVVGIHDGHNAAAAVIEDGVVRMMLQEERFTRIKNQGDAPAAAAREALTLARDPHPQIALNGLYMNYGQWQRETVMRDYEQSSSVAARWKQPLKNSFVDKLYQKHQAEVRSDRLAEIGLKRAALKPVEHHTAHAAAAYYTAPWRDSHSRAETLVLTCDGSGDRLSATVSIGRGNELTRIAEVSEHDSIGRVYALITRLMGMVPLEHEYKVMGLAPYAGNSQGVRGVTEMLCGLFEFTKDPMVWRRTSGVPSMYSAFEFLKRMLDGQRFDWIAGGAQRFIETMLTTWVRNAIRETGIRRLACAGGVFMNVKANLALLDIPEVEDLYVFPSCGDESNSVGAAAYLAAQAGQDVKPLGGIYFGQPIADEEAQQALEAAARNSNCFRFRHFENIERQTAEKLAQGKIVARAKGQAEFGARALGNRSILSRADSPSALRVINEMVKNRDFWMPFAPSVLAERVDNYCEKPKGIASPYMMFALRSRPAKRAAFGAAQHPYDFTARPHEVTAAHNPDYHRLLSEFESITGEGICLNTSFNLHGEPIVHRAADAVSVFLRSGLECMALANWWVEKSLRVMNVLLTGAAGFIGAHTAARLLDQGHRVVGADNLNSYYDPRLKHARLALLEPLNGFHFVRCDLANREQAERLFERGQFDLVIHLAAQAGVRYSLENPHAYTASNITGFLNVLEGCRHHAVPRLIYASSSSVYGGNTKTPFAVGDRVETPVSLYAATKKSNELMAHVYTHLFGIATTGLRFFTVYGPWGRPDMAPFKFARAIEAGEPIDIYNYGRMRRDFTYIDDIVEGVVRIAARQPAGYRVFNIGNSAPVPLMDFVHAMECAFGRRARRRFLPLQPGDVLETHADVEDFWNLTGFRPQTGIEEGVARFVTWYRDYMGATLDGMPVAVPA